jgi:hypothetical protein
MATDLVGFTDICCDGTRVSAPWGDGAPAELHIQEPGKPVQIIALPDRAIYVSAERTDTGVLVVAWNSQHDDQPGRWWRSDTWQIGTLELLTGEYPTLVGPDGSIYYFPASGGAMSFIERQPDGARDVVASGLTSQGFGGFGEEGQPVLMDSMMAVMLGGITFARAWRHGDWTVGGDVHADRVLAYHHPTSTPYVVANVATPIGPRVRTLADGSAVCAISLPGRWVPSASFIAYAPPPVKIPTFATQQASVLVIGDHAAPETIAVIDRPDDPRDGSTRGVFATEFANDLTLGAAQAASLDTPLYVYRDRRTYGPDPIYTQPGCTVMPTLRGYPERDGAGWMTVDARMADLEPQVTAAEHAGYRGSLAMVLPVYTASGAWTVEQVLAHIDAAVTRFAGRIRTWILFEQARGTNDGIAHVPAFAQAAAQLKTACALPAPRAVHVSQPPAAPVPTPNPEPPAPPPPHQEPPMPDPSAVPPPPPTLDEQLAAYHAPREQSPGPGYVWMGGHWNYYGTGAASANASMAANAAAQSATPQGAPATPSVVPVTKRLHVDGPIFRTDDGQPWQWRGESMLILPYLWHTGVDVRPVLRAALARGTNIVRCFLQHKYMLWPQVVDFVLPIDRVGPLADLLRDEGVYGLFTIGCDGQADALAQSYEWQRDRVRDVVGVSAGKVNLALELWNKEQAGVNPDDNGCDVVRIAQDLGLFDRANRPVPMALGYYPKTGHEPNFPVLDFVAGKQPRETTWTTECGKIGRNVTEQTGAAYNESEPPKFSAPDNPDGEGDEHDPVESPRRAEEGAAGCALAGTGFTFHSVSGIHAVPLSPLEQTCCERAMRAMAAIPADAATGEYVHDGMAQHPLEPVGDPAVVGEVAGRVLDSRAIVVAAMPSPQWNPVARDGWRIVDRKGELGQIVFLER